MSYEPVPVKEAKAIADQYDKSIVIIFAWDPVHGLLHTTTYGDTPENKANAARGGEIGTKALGGLLELATDFEDYRLEQAQKLLQALRDIATRGMTMHEMRELAASVVAEAEKWVR